MYHTNAPVLLASPPQASKPSASALSALSGPKSYPSPRPDVSLRFVKQACRSPVLLGLYFLFLSACDSFLAVPLHFRVLDWRFLEVYGPVWSSLEFACQR